MLGTGKGTDPALNKSRAMPRSGHLTCREEEKHSELFLRKNCGMRLLKLVVFIACFM